MLKGVPPMRQHEVGADTGFEHDILLCVFVANFDAVFDSTLALASFDSTSGVCDLQSTI